MPTLTLDHSRSLTIPAEFLDKLGLQPGDTLVGVEWNAMLRRLGGKPGDQVAFDYERDGKRGHAQFNLKPYL